MGLKDIEPTPEERRKRNIIKALPECPWCGGPKDFNTICWKCYNEAWRKAHEQS